MRQNPLALVATIVSLAMSGICCVAGMAFVLFTTVMRGTSTPEPIYAEAPVYAPPPTYVPPVRPAPSGVTGDVATGSLAIADNATRGPVGAPITIHVVSDFQCPFCSRVEPTLAQLDAANAGQIRWVWHDYPLPFHQNAMPAAEAAREVRRQLGDEAFWRFHDALFENNRSLDASSIEQLASATPGLDMAAYRTAMQSHQHEAAVRADMAAVDAAVSSGSVGTPCFLINGQWLRGAQPLARFQEAVDGARARPSM
jgi:protein-disulfide isomerase